MAKYYLPSGTWIVTLFFADSDTRQGWSEVWYTTGTDAAAVEAKINSYVNARKAVMTDRVRIEEARFGVNDKRGETYYLDINQVGSVVSTSDPATAAVDADDAEHPNLCLLLRLQGAGGEHASKYLSGLASESAHNGLIITDSTVAGFEPAGAAWTALFSAIEANWSIKKRPTVLGVVFYTLVAINKVRVERITTRKRGRGNMHFRGRR